MESHTHSQTAAAAAADAAARADALCYNFISCLILTAQNGFGRDVEPFLALSRETWGEEQLWAAVKDLPHGTLRREGPAKRFYPTFSREAGPYSMARTRLMYAAQAGDAARLRWLLARGSRLELKDWAGRMALSWASGRASGAGSLEVVRELLARGAAVGAADDNGTAPLHYASAAGHLEVVRELLARGAMVNAATIDGTSVLRVPWRTPGGGARAARAGRRVRRREQQRLHPFAHRLPDGPLGGGAGASGAGRRDGRRGRRRQHAPA